MSISLKKTMFLAAAATVAAAAAILEDRGPECTPGEYGCAASDWGSIGVCTVAGHWVHLANCGGRNCCSLIADQPYCIC